MAKIVEEGREEEERGMEVERGTYM